MSRRGHQCACARITLDGLKKSMTSPALSWRSREIDSSASIAVIGTTRTVDEAQRGAFAECMPDRGGGESGERTRREEKRKWPARRGEGAARVGGASVRRPNSGTQPGNLRRSALPFGAQFVSSRSARRLRPRRSRPTFAKTETEQKERGDRGGEEEAETVDRTVSRSATPVNETPGQFLFSFSVFGIFLPERGTRSALKVSRIVPAVTFAVKRPSGSVKVVIIQCAFVVPGTVDHPRVNSSGDRTYGVGTRAVAREGERERSAYALPPRRGAPRRPSTFRVAASARDKMALAFVRAPLSTVTNCRHRSPRPF